MPWIAYARRYDPDGVFPYSLSNPRPSLRKTTTTPPPTGSSLGQVASRNARRPCYGWNHWIPLKP